MQSLLQLIEWMIIKLYKNKKRVMRELLDEYLLYEVANIVKLDMQR